MSAALKHGQRALLRARKAALDYHTELAATLREIDEALEMIKTEISDEMPTNPGTPTSKSQELRISGVAARVDAELQKGRTR